MSAQVNAADVNKIYWIELNDDTINPVTAEYIQQSINLAQDDNARCLIIKLDTPGGLLNSTRSIVKAILQSDVPIVVYIAPGGARAGSAGVFITYASHIAAMAPSTNIGAAHPVQLGGKSPGPLGKWDEILDQGRQKKTKEPFDESSGSDDDKSGTIVESDEDYDPMRSKVLNDTVAFIRSIALERNRNVQWAVESVVESKSITNQEALDKGVIDLVARDESDLIQQLDGRVIQLKGKEHTLITENARLERLTMNASQKFFNILADPNIAYFLMILGFYGLLYEITHPGFGLPGILGSIFLVLAFYSMQTLPTNYAGLALMLLGIILFITEAYVPGFGLFALSGLVCLVLGSMLLFKSTDPVMRVSISSIIALSLTTTGITLFLVRSVITAQKAKVHGGVEGLIGETGVARLDILKHSSGKVDIHGEIWSASSDDDIRKGDEVIVQSIKGLKIKVKKV